MKNKITVFTIITAIVLPLILGMSACSCNGSDINWDNLKIKDFASYSALGAAVFYDDEISADNISSAGVMIANASESNVRLVGQKKDGTYEIVAFVEEDGKVLEQSLQLNEIGGYNNFTFLRYNTSLDYDQVQITLKTYAARNAYANGQIEKKDDYYLAVDNSTGKIFDMNEAMSKICGEDKDHVGGYMFNYKECGEFSYIFYRADDFHNLEEGSTTAKELYGGIYKMQSGNDTLELTRVLPENKVEDFFGCSIYDPDLIEDAISIDKFGNIYSNVNKCSTYSDSSSAKRADPYILRKDGTVSALKNQAEAGRLFIAMDNKVYLVTEENTKYFDENGQLTDSCFTPPTDYFIREDVFEERGYKIYEKDNSKYFYGKKKDYQYVHKFTFNEDGFIYDKIALKDCSLDSETSFICTNGKLYFLDETEVFYCNLDTGEKTTLASDYKFKTIKAGLDGKLYFTGINDELDSVYGIIDENDNVQTDVKEFVNNMEVVYVNPIN